MGLRIGLLRPGQSVKVKRGMRGAAGLQVRDAAVEVVQRPETLDPKPVAGCLLVRADHLREREAVAGRARQWLLVSRDGRGVAGSVLVGRVVQRCSPSPHTYAVRVSGSMTWMNPNRTPRSRKPPIITCTISTSPRSSSARSAN